MEAPIPRSKKSKVVARSNETAEENLGPPPPPPGTVEQLTEPQQSTSEPAVGGDNQEEPLAVVVESQAPTTSQPGDDTRETELSALLQQYDAVKSAAEPGENRPNLFDQPQRYDQIIELRRELEHPTLSKYLLDFETTVKPDALVVGQITLQEVQEEERLLRSEHVLYEEQEQEKVRQMREALLLTEMEVKRRLANDFRDKQKHLQRQEELLKQIKRLAQDELHKSFRRSELDLMEKLENRKAEVKALYGDIQPLPGKYSGLEGRRWKVDWDRTPQPIQVKVKTVRGVRDKLPAGRYVLLISLFDRLGGQVQRWSKLKGQYWGATTVPVSHTGHFHQAELRLEQSVFSVVPPRPEIRPGMVFTFELFLLRGAVVPVDTVVGWGVFPICNGSFQYIEGKFKLPLIRGFLDPSIDKHEKLEWLVARDLDNWLANLYIEIVRLPRFMAGQREYEVELQFSSELLSFPDRVDGKMVERCIDGEDPEFSPSTGIITETSGPATSAGKSLEGSKLALEMDERRSSSADTDSGNDMDSQGTSWATSDQKGSAGRKWKDKWPDVPGKVDQPGHFKRNSKHGSSELSSIAEKSAVKTYLGQPQHQSYLSSRVVHLSEEPGFAGRWVTPPETLYTLGEIEEDRYKPVLGEPGIYYKHYRKTVRDDYEEAINSLLPRTPRLRGQDLADERNKRKKTRLQELEEYTFAVSKPFDASSPEGRSIGSTRLGYVRRMFLAELGFSNWRSSEFWLMLLFLLFCFFLRFFLHYCGQWIYLTLDNIPINTFNFYAWTVQLNYQPTLLSVGEETVVVMLGPMSDIIVFVLLMVISAIAQAAVGSFPNIGSKFILAFGTLTLLDPLLILIVDLILQRHIYTGGVNPTADAAKLYYNFLRSQGSGVGGLILTLLIYVLTTTLILTLLYVYFLRLHNEGRMLDIYWRLFSEDSKFFIPYDLEVSHQELTHVVKRAEQWRGEEGERRKVTVTDYIWEEEAIDEDGNETGQSVKVETTTHVALHTVHLDGLRELFRHFLRMPDGAIIEVMGDNLSIPAMDEGLKMALLQGTKEFMKPESEGAPPQDLEDGIEKKPLGRKTSKAIDLKKPGKKALVDESKERSKK